MIPGFASPEGTARFAARFPLPSQHSFFRRAQQLSVSSLGIGSYLGAISDAVDASYTQATLAAVQNGINFIDTSLNYRNQHSERAIGAALRKLIHPSDFSRDEIILCTKAGYLVPDAVPPSQFDPLEIAGGMHCLATAFLSDQIERSCENLGVNTLDIFYLHNPETQLRFVSEEVFYHRIAAAFQLLEQLAASGRIRHYGVATWDGFRKNGQPGSLSLTRLGSLAESTSGPNHHFRFIQLPFNLAMPEAFTQRAESLHGVPTSVLDAAASLGISVIASASLLQARLASELSEELATRIPAPSDAVRAIQFARSAPGIHVALTGMSQQQHVLDNLRIAAQPPLSSGDFTSIFR